MERVVEESESISLLGRIFLIIHAPLIVGKHGIKVNTIEALKNRFVINTEQRREKKASRQKEEQQGGDKWDIA